MKKVLSTLLAISMLLTMLGGVILIDTSAGEVTPADAKYEYIDLSGVSGWTQENLNKTSGNRGYDGGYMQSAVSSRYDVSDQYVIGNATQSIKLTVNPVNDQAYNASLVTHDSTNAGVSPLTNPWVPVDDSALSDCDGVRIAIMDKNGEPATFKYVELRVLNAANGWSNYWRYVGKPDTDADGYTVFDFSRFFRASTTSTQLTIGEQVNTIDSISLLMYGGADNDILYISDFQGMKRVEGGKRSDSMVFAQLPGIQDWTNDNLNAHNALTGINSGMQFSNSGLMGTAEKSLQFKGDQKPNNWTLSFTTQTSTDKTAAQQNGNVMGEYSKLADMLKYDGIRIAVTKPDGTAAIPFSWDSSKHVQAKLILIGSAQKSFDNAWYPYATMEYSTASGQPFENYEDGYLYFYFKDARNGWGGNFYDTYKNSTSLYGNISLQLVGGGINQGTNRLWCVSDMQLFREKTAEDLLAPYWEYNYSPASWAKLEEAANTLNEAAVVAAAAELEPVVFSKRGENVFKDWTSESVNAVVTANSDKLCDSIGAGLNQNGSWDAGDFTNNTTFAAADGVFSMTATADFTGKSMGWKNLDRVGTLAGAEMGAYPAADFSALPEGEGIRMKVEVSEGGSFGRLFFGLSNCKDMTKEMYALKILPEYIGADGYINIPFSYFQKAFWAPAFTNENVDDAICFVVQAYDVTNGTTISFSDFTGYSTRTVTADDLADLGALIDNLEAFDIDGRYSELIADAKAIGDGGLYYDFKGTYDELFEVLKTYKDPDTAVVSVPGYSVYTQEELDQFATRANGTSGVTVTKVDDGVKVVFSNGSYEFINGAAPADSEGYGNCDTHYGAFFPINGKTIVDMLGGYKLSDISAFRFKVENPSDYAIIKFKGPGTPGNMWNDLGFFTKPQTVYYSNGYYTFDPAAIQAGGDSWYIPGISNDYIRENTAAFIFDASKIQNKKIYNWEVILFPTVDRSSLKAALVDYADLGLTSYDSALETYYNANATVLNMARAVSAMDLEAAKLDAADLWQYNYTADSWAPLATALTGTNAANITAAIRGLVPISYYTFADKAFDGWTTENVNAVVTANSDKLTDNIGDGLNANGVWNSGDFSNNTTFAVADGAFSMTANADFIGKSMGWKNLDRLGTLAGEEMGAYPALGLKNLSYADGIRVKIDVSEGGSVGRILIGLSNCKDFTREMYALSIKPENVGADGYVTIPFSYFQKAWWCSAFAQSELDKAICLIFEAYDVTSGTTLTLSDMYAYSTRISTADEFAGLGALIANLEAFDIDDRYSELIAEAKAIEAGGFYYELKSVYDEVFAVLESYKDPDASIVSVPGYSIYTQAELDQFATRKNGTSGVTVTKVDDGVTVVFSNGSYEFINGGAPGAGEGYASDAPDTHYGSFHPINGKTIVDMLGGYKLSDISAFRFKVENPSGYINIKYKGPGNPTNMWDNMGFFTKAQTAYSSNGYYTFNPADIQAGGDGWYVTDISNAYIRENTVGFIVDASKISNKKIYDWEVILYDSIDRSGLKTALAAAEGLDLENYETALATYYNAEATQAEIGAAALDLNKTINTPDAPVIESSEITATSIAITVIDGVQYKLGADGAWTNTPVFEGLMANTEYTVYAQYVETRTAYASEISSVVFKTLKGSFGEATISISGTERYLGVLTANVADVPEELGDYSFEWYCGEELIGEDETYTIPAEMIGEKVYVVLVSDNADGTVTSDETGIIGKSLITGYTLPTVSDIQYPQTLVESLFTGGDTGIVVGTWSWVTPNAMPTSAQTGNAFDAIFTPSEDFIDLYEVLEVKISVTIIPAEYEPRTIVDECGISVFGEFMPAAEIGVADITFRMPAYLALLRASGKDESNLKKLVLFKTLTVSVNGETEGDFYDGTLTVKSYVGLDRAGESYSVWFFVDGAPVNYTGTVSAEGILVIEGVIL